MSHTSEGRAIEQSRQAVATLLHTSDSLDFRDARMVDEDNEAVVCGEVGGKAGYRPFAYIVSSGKAMVMPAGLSAPTATADFPDDCIPDQTSGAQVAAHQS